MERCRDCGSYFRRGAQRTCRHCQSNVCQKCIVETPFTPTSTAVYCLSCFSFVSMRGESVNQLEKHSVIDLREYLQAHNIPIPSYCRERRDFAEFIIRTPITRDNERAAIIYFIEKRRREKEEKDAWEREQQERENLEREEQERARLAWERQERERFELERMLRERTESERIAREAMQRLNERVERQRMERMERERAERVRMQGETLSRDRAARERMERERFERPEEERFERERRPSSQPQTPEITLEALSNQKNMIGQLGIKEIKAILEKNGMNPSLYQERAELVSALELLVDTFIKEKMAVAASEEGGGSDDAGLCKICMDQAVNCVYLECGHIFSCVDCGRRLSECPVCRRSIVRIVRTFQA